MNRTKLFAAALVVLGFASCNSSDEMELYIDMRPSEEIPQIVNQADESNGNMAIDDASLTGMNPEIQ